ncbi:MAG: hypothetical protein JF615_04220 [Asticcacaulis sp.]|nr:hypothetical protein [Asticcacaulis sp.]
MAAGNLRFRKPDKTWMLLAGLAALCLHGIIWFVARKVFGDDDAVGETQRQMVLAVFWIIGAVILWRISMPPSRLHATFGVLTCALFVTVLGSGAALIKLLTVEGAEPTQDLLTTFAMLSLVLVLAQMVVAVPTALLLQGLALSRKGD